MTWDHSVGTAAIGGPFYTGTLYPQQYQGSFFYADYTGNFIKRIVFDAQHNPVGATSFATDVQSPVSLEVGPDGMIYYNSFTTGEIRRIRYNGPVAVASATPKYGYSPLTVSFSSVGSAESRRRDADLPVELRRRGDLDGCEPDPHLHVDRRFVVGRAPDGHEHRRADVHGDGSDRRGQHAAGPDDHGARRRHDRAPRSDGHVPGVGDRP